MKPTLTEARLDAVEMRAANALVARLREELGSDLVAVWLYGSRARREVPHPESDIDVMVVVRSADWRREHAVARLAWEAVDGAGGNEGRFSVLVRTPEWLRERREIESFFMQEVDRDKIVLHGAA